MMSVIVAIFLSKTHEVFIFVLLSQDCVFYSGSFVTYKFYNFFPISVKNAIAILIGNAMNLYIVLGSMDI